MKFKFLIVGAVAMAVGLPALAPLSPAQAASGYTTESKQEKRLLRQQRKAERRAQKQIQREQRQERFAEQERREEAFEERYGRRDRFDDPFFDRGPGWRYGPYASWRYGLYGDPFYDPYFGAPPWWW
jgi:hypothetical protein